jgi:beta-glucosidase
VAVLLSGRPLWVNREINAANAFVAAWLPGTEGGGVADVLVGTAQGTPRFDFTGRLARSWPGSPDQATLNRGDAASVPLFAYGYGASYARPVRVGALDEAGAVLTSTGGDAFFATGRMQGATRATVRDAGGERFAPADAGTASPNGVLTMRVTDAGAQENGRALVWSGAGAGTLEFIGLTRDLSRQANGDMALAITYTLEQAPTAAVTLGIGCGEGCMGRVDITGLLRDAPPDQLRTMKVKLSCLAGRGADMSRVDRPMVIETTGRLALVLREVRLSSNEGDAICPPR